MEKKLKRVFTSLKSRTENVGSSNNRRRGSSDNNAADDTPEGNLLQAINGFCETGGPGNPNANEEFVYLPTIVEIAESSPSAAAIAATVIRKNLDIKNASRPYVQYNSIMLMRILAQNPGPNFTRNLSDPKFGNVVKELLRQGRDPSVFQLLCETLSHFSDDPPRIADEGLNLLREVWIKEKKGIENTRKKTGPALVLAPAPNFTSGSAGNSRGYAPPLPPRGTLPSLEELVARVSEANTSAKLLEQLVQSTSQEELMSNDLIKEFADRCKLAHRSMRDYISADNPPPDEDTLTTLIETNDLLRIALETHRKAVAAALQSKETSGDDQNARIVNIGELRTSDAVMHGAANNDSDLRSPISSNDPPTASQTTPPQPVTYRF